MYEQLGEEIDVASYEGTLCVGGLVRREVFSQALVAGDVAAGETAGGLAS